MPQPKTKNIEIEETLTSPENLAVIIVFNDDDNTFEWVTTSFIEVCELDFDDALKKTYIIHFNGQSEVCSGEYELMKAKKDRLVERNLHAIVTRPELN